MTGKLLHLIIVSIFERGFFATLIRVLDRLIKRIAIRLVPCLYKVDKKKIIFLYFTGNYDCNPKAICQRMIDEGLDAHYVWAVNPKTRTGPKFFPRGIKFVKRGTYAFYKELFTARVIVDNGVSTATLKYHKKRNQYLIETWHGSLGIKKFGRDSNKDKKWLRNAAKEGRMTDFIISNSTFEDAVYREDFWKKTPIWQFGHPRNDILFCTDEEKIAALQQKIRKKYKIQEDFQLCMYAPTFRDDGDLSPYVIDYDRLIAALRERFRGEWVILTRFHSRTKKYLKGVKLPKSVINVSGYPDIQELMLCIDVGITDYSSWICEYMLRRKPGFMFATDLDVYVENNRSLFFPLSELPFPVAGDEDTLVRNILAFDGEKFVSDCDAFLKDKGSIDDGRASERTVAEIKKLMDVKPVFAEPESDLPPGFERVEEEDTDEADIAAAQETAENTETVIIDVNGEEEE